MTEWARRIQASIESMNRLVDGFQLAGGGSSSRSSGVSGTVTSPDSSMSGVPRRDDGDALSSGGTADSASRATGSRSGGSRGVERAVVGAAAAAAAAGAPPSSSSLSAYGLEGFASAQLGFRRGLEGLVKSGVGGGGGGASRTGFLSSRAGFRSGTAAWTLPPGETAAAASSSSSGGSDGGGGSTSASGGGRTSRSFSPPALEGVDGRPGPAEHRSADRSQEEKRKGEDESSGGWEEAKGEGAVRWEASDGVVGASGGGGGGIKPFVRSSLSSSSASSVMGRADAVLAEAARGIGLGSAAAAAVGGGGYGSSSLSSSTGSNSLGPDLEAEIASLEALAESLQQRKMRFEPKVPDDSLFSRKCERLFFVLV